ncbi:MAG TPA: MlaD family protein [Blastocatellia bacterium]|nr:MlaD family protein [Blastocatellia bacterium]
MSRKKTTLSELRVGILAVATIVILVVFILSVTGDISIFRDTRTYTTRFAAAEGLKEGDEVRLAGKRVGQVSSVDFGAEIPVSKDDKPIVVTMTVNATEVRDRIRADSMAVLGQQGFLGDRVIDITPGTRSATPLGDGAEIPSADVTGLAQVFQGASDILIQFNVVGKQLQELVDNINKGEGTIGKLLHDDALYVNLNRTVIEGQALLKRVQEGQGTIARFLNDPTLYNDIRGATNELQAIAADLRSGKGTAGKLLNDEQLYARLNDAVGKANSTLEKVDRITAEIEAGRGTLGKFVKDESLHNEVQATVASLRGITERLNKGEGTAGMLLHDDKLYNSFNQMSTEMVKLLYDFRQNPRKYLSIRVSLF